MISNKGESELAVLPFSIGELVLALLSGAVVTYWAYRRRKRDRETQWRIENGYEAALAEVNAILNEDKYPGTSRNRKRNSFANDIADSDEPRHSPEFLEKCGEYLGRLHSLERAEREFTPLNQNIVDLFPDDVVRTEGTEVSLLVGGDTDIGDSTPKMNIMSTWTTIDGLFTGSDSEMFDADSAEEIRALLTPDGGFGGNSDENLRSRPPGCTLSYKQIKFWEREIPDWHDHIYQLINQGYAEDYLNAREQQYNTQQEVKEAAETIRGLIREEMASLNPDR
jgi:hypothetical protein